MIRRHTAQAVPDLEAAEDAVKDAKAVRSAARAAWAEGRNAAITAAAKAEREQWADPVLTEAVAEARRVLSLAEAARDSLAAGLRARYEAKDRRDATTARANNVPFSTATFAGVDRTGGRIADDEEYQAAQHVVKLATGDLRRLQRDAERSALGRQYLAGTRPRLERLAAATTRGKLDALAGYEAQEAALLARIAPRKDGQP